MNTIGDNIKKLREQKGLSQKELAGMIEVEVKDKSLMDKVKLIDQLPAEEKETVLKVIDMALTKKKMKDFFQKNVASL